MQTLRVVVCLQEKITMIIICVVIARINGKSHDYKVWIKLALKSQIH